MSSKDKEEAVKEAEKGVTTYAEDILDPPLYHVFAKILTLDLDGKHSKFCALFAEHCPTWAQFIDLGEDLEGSTYKDAQTGEVLPLPALDFVRIRKIIMFSEAQLSWYYQYYFEKYR